MEKNTVAELTVLYKECPITRLLFENTDLADNFANALMALLDEEAKEDFSFGREIKTIYTAESAVQQLRDWGNGKIKPEGTVLDWIKKIDDLV